MFFQKIALARLPSQHNMQQQAKRHHYVPKAYLKAFCDQKGKILVYRKDHPHKPLHVVPDATQFRRYYYSQPLPGGGGSQDNNKLEKFFSTIESSWPATVAELHEGKIIKLKRLQNIFDFMTIQRVRVPAARDAAEAAMAQYGKDMLKNMRANGEFSLPPSVLEDFPNNVIVSIDPHQSIHAMVLSMQAMGPLYSMIGLEVIHNATARPFLTSDNPVLWFDPSLPFDEQLPYTINPDGGPMELIFPVSPWLAIFGSTAPEIKDTYRQHGLQHRDVTDEACIDMANAQICRFAYETVIAQSAGQEEMIVKYANVSPVHKAVVLHDKGKGVLTFHQQVFGPRVPKPKYRPREGYSQPA